MPLGSIRSPYAPNDSGPVSEKLSGEDKYHIQQGNHPILYGIQDQAFIVRIRIALPRIRGMDPAPYPTTAPRVSSGDLPVAQSFTVRRRRARAWNVPGPSGPASSSASAVVSMLRPIP